ncbi:MAG: FHA domain-containing protein, partial [Planctomycetes bacterium]|nr:FHA domain-containing protein [Planctomycetota bacterium]
MSFLRLQYTRSDGEVDTYHLKSGRRYNVGRGSACEVRILDMRLSRKHCAFEDLDGQWVLSDLGSTNGCKIAKKRIEGDIPVEGDTKVTLGSVEIYVANISEHIDQKSSESARNATVGEDRKSTQVEPDIDIEATQESAAEPQAEEEAQSDKDASAETSEKTESKEVSSSPFESESIEDSDDFIGAEPTVKDDASGKNKSDYEPSTSKIRLESLKDDQPVETKTVFISALGRKVGPITRTQARELKKRELKG